MWFYLFIFFLSCYQAGEPWSFPSLFSRVLASFPASSFVASITHPVNKKTLLDQSWVNNVVHLVMNKYFTETCVRTKIWKGHCLNSFQWDVKRNHEQRYHRRETGLALFSFWLKSGFVLVLILVLVMLCPCERICLASCRKQRGAVEDWWSI